MMRWEVQVMPVGPLSTGAVAVYVGLPSGSGAAISPAAAAVVGAAAVLGGNLAGQRNIVLLGTGRTAPRYLIERAWIPFFNDLGGSAMPFDELYSGTRALVSMDLNFYDPNVLQIIESVPNGPFSSFGTSALLDQATFMVAEGAAMPLYLRFLNYGKAFYRSLGLPPGVRFAFSWLLGPDRHEPGSQAKQINLIWRCQRGLIAANGMMTFADNNMTGVPAFPGLKNQ
jgi:hypothetical protein